MVLPSNTALSIIRKDGLSYGLGGPFHFPSHDGHFFVPSSTCRVPLANFEVKNHEQEIPQPRVVYAAGTMQEACAGGVCPGLAEHVVGLSKISQEPNSLA